MTAPYEQPEAHRSRAASPTSPESRRWLTRVHLPLPESPSLAAFAAWGGRCEAQNQPWIAWHDAQTGARYLAGGALSSWSLEPRGAFQEAARLSSRLRERVVVEPQAAALLRDLPLLWHGFAFSAGDWTGPNEPSGSGRWPGGELRLPAWLLYARAGQAGLVVHAWGQGEGSPGAVHSRLNAQARALLSCPPLGETTPGAVLGSDPVEEARFQSRVAQATATMAAGAGKKVVLSRRATARTEGTFDAAATWLALSSDPSARAFAWSRGRDGQLVGASPELLLAIRGDRIESEALAGTAALDRAAWLARDPKNLREHELVVEAVSALLAEQCGAVERAPRTLRRLRGLAHLQTSLWAARQPDHDLLSLANSLHPTPALGGAPRAFALKWLADEERGWFGAPLGYSDQDGGGELLVTIRSALLRGSVAELFAGAGILAESDPEQEWQETNLKLATATQALCARRNS
ncbi:MAG: isochorismate synthase [Planctomycetes bacterium]|nr:isochorismate synthase [Planctomycetota bacterium]